MSLHEIEAEYIYCDPMNNPKLRVVRALNTETKRKAFWQYRMAESGKWEKGGTKEEITPYRYNEWVNKPGPVFHVEGEKCVDRLVKAGFFATTSPGGAKAWRKSLAKYYKDQDVIIIPDNDGVGRLYAKQVAAEIVKYAKSVKIVDLPDLLDGEDVFDWLESGGTEVELQEVCEAAPTWTPAPEDQAGNSGRDGSVASDSLAREKIEPTSDDYFTFFEDRLHGPKRDIISGELMAKVGEAWQPASSRLDILGSYAFDSFLFKKARLKEHMARFAETKTSELLIDIPPWDGVDRVRQFVNCVHLANCLSEHFYQLLCDWGARLFLRLENPKIQNRVIVLQGPQGIGKDRLIDEIVEGFGQFSANVTITNERDTQAAVGSLIVAKISEFDRTARTEISTLKDLITREHTFIRLPYDRAAKLRPMRSSFVASVNIAEILRDHTGNRRFLIFKIEKIDWNYPLGQSLQILAQFKNLAATGFSASAESEAAMKEYIEGQTPDDPKVAILEAFDERICALEKNASRIEFSSSEIFPLLEDITRSFGYKANTILHILKMNGRSRRTNAGMKYFRTHD